VTSPSMYRMQINLSANNFQRVKTGSGYRQLLKYNKRPLTQLTNSFSKSEKNIFLAEILKKLFGSWQFQRVGREGETLNILFLAWIFQSTPGTHDKYFFLHILFHSNFIAPKTINSVTYCFIIIVQPEYSKIYFNNIVTSRLCDNVFTKIKLSEVWSFVFPLLLDI